MINIDYVLASMGGHGRMKAMVNARDYVKIDENTFRFRFSGSPKHSLCQIHYDCGQDLFNILFYRGSKETKRIDGLYVEQLKQVFENTTGLYLSL